jgi:hypothetical protein
MDLLSIYKGNSNLKFYLDTVMDLFKKITQGL